ncbi:hypothetical protein ACFQX7_24985 [Luedemannella flava]
MNRTGRWPLPGEPRVWLAASGGAIAALLVTVVVLATTRGPAGRTIGLSSGELPTGGAAPVTGPLVDGSTGMDTPDAATPSMPTVAPVEGGVVCPPATVVVSNGESLAIALADAEAGASILMADGLYEGTFVAERPGTADKPIFLCGGSGAVIDEGSVKGGYGMHLDGASYWRLVGFTVRNAQKGVMADKVTFAVIQGLTVERIGDEGIHLRNFSTDNLVIGNTVRRTGERRDKFGEGL